MFSRKTIFCVCDLPNRISLHHIRASSLFESFEHSSDYKQTKSSSLFLQNCHIFIIWQERHNYRNLLWCQWATWHFPRDVEMYWNSTQNHINQSNVSTFSHFLLLTKPPHTAHHLAVRRGTRNHQNRTLFGYCTSRYVFCSNSTSLKSRSSASCYLVVTPLWLDEISRKRTLIILLSVQSSCDTILT